MPPRAAGRKPAAAASAGRPKAPTKEQTIAAVALRAEVPKAEAARVLKAQAEVAADSLRRQKVALIPGVAKLTAVHKPATPARPGVNPFTKERTVFKAKPARTDVKARVLKGFKDGV